MYHNPFSLRWIRIGKQEHQHSPKFKLNENITVVRWSCGVRVELMLGKYVPEGKYALVSKHALMGKYCPGRQNGHKMTFDVGTPLSLNKQTSKLVGKHCRHIRFHTKP